MRLITIMAILNQALGQVASGQVALGQVALGQVVEKRNQVLVLKDLVIKI